MARIQREASETILEALVEVQTPVELIGELVEVGERRLEQQQELSHIPNPTGYLIGIMRNLAVEAWLKGWNLAQIQAEDEEKHAQAVRAAQRGESCVFRGESEVCPAVEEVPPAASGAALSDPSTASEPPSCLPDGVEVADPATVATWQDHLPDAQGSQPRAVSMLWGFVRDEIKDRLNIARRQQLDALTPKWDATRPRTLLLLCHLTYTARAVELNLRREISRSSANCCRGSLTSSRWCMRLDRRNQHERPV